MEGAFVEPRFNRYRGNEFSNAGSGSNFGRIGGSWIVGFQASKQLHGRQSVVDDKFGKQELSTMRLSNSFTDAIKSDSFTALGDKTNTYPNLVNQALSKFDIQNTKQGPCLKSPKQRLLRRSKTFRQIPKIQPAPQKKVVLRSEYGTAIINGNEEPALIPKLDLKNLNKDQGDTLKLPIARRGILQQNGEVFDLLMQRKGTQSQSKAAVSDWSVSSFAPSQRSFGSSESFSEIPDDCPPTYRGESPPLQRHKSLCVTDDKQMVDLDLKGVFEELKSKKHSRNLSIMNTCNNIPEQIDNRDLE